MKVSVSQLNTYVKQSLACDPVLTDITVSGEVSGIKYHSSGHIYFTLKDESAAIRCAFFKPHSLKRTFDPRDGMKVLARGRVTLFERDGSYQLNVSSMEKDGEGELFKQFELLKKKLDEEGLFDPAHKKMIPRFVRKIGVATSPTGAVIRDIIHVSTRRCPGIQIVLAPVAVQGEDAPRSICAGLRALDERDDVDVIIVGRGGGSMEDLWCFNDESVARTIFACQKPVISAVGHETDFTIADFVADLRAPTPSAAAEVAVFDMDDAQEELLYEQKRLFDLAQSRLMRLTERLLRARETFADPLSVLQPYRKRRDILSVRLFAAQEAIKEKEKSRLANLTGKLDALSPMKVLSRGYAVAVNERGEAVKRKQEVKPGDRLTVILSDGAIQTEVTE